MIAIPFAVFIAGLVFTIYCIYDFEKKKIEGESQAEWWKASIIIVILLLVGVLGVSMKTAKLSTLSTMRQRLNEPIISETQLYGYEIVGKHMEEYGSPDDTSYFIDIRDILTNKKTLMHVKISPELYEKVKIGNSFDYTLMGKLKVPGLEAPVPQDL